MSLSQKATYAQEQLKWDESAKKQLSSIKEVFPGEDFYTYANRTATFVGVTDFLGDLHGKCVLEYGCGLGDISILLAKSGAKVVSFDISEASIQVSAQKAKVNKTGNELALSVAAGENLPYANESFDVIFGKAILHHLSVKLGHYDLYRVLKKGGKAVFIEPMGMNPFINFARAYVPYPHKHPRGSDRPLNYDEINAWGRQFKDFRYREIQLFSMLERGLGFNKRLLFLRKLDEVVLRNIPYLRRYCRYVVMYIVK
jgi:ubiquinone/menaquinone biosynthesis C-methylase UbiE